MSQILEGLGRLEPHDAGRERPELLVEGPSRDQSFSSVLAGPEFLRGIAHVHCEPGRAGRILACNGGNWSALEKFRYLGHRLQQLRSKRTLSRVLVTSAIPKEGKTVVSVNLAAVLARGSSRVLLIDADMRQANVRGLLGEPSRTGLADLLEGRETLSSALRFIDLLGIFYLPAGFPSSNPVELLQGQRMRDLMQATAAAFDWVVLDSPPLNVFADAHCLAGLSDGTLLVVRSGVTPREGFEEAIAALDGSFLAGIVLNGCEDERRDRYYYRSTGKPVRADTSASQKQDGTP